MREGIANDPYRKERIAQAALEVITEGGLWVATHRTIAARDILLDTICGSGRPTDREMRLAREVYAYGSVSDRVADLVRADYAATIDALKKDLPEPAARTIDAIADSFAAPADRKAITGETND